MKSKKVKKKEATPIAQLVTLAAFLPWGGSQGAYRMTSGRKFT